MKIQINKKLLEVYPDAQFIAITATNFGNEKKNPDFEKEREKITKQIRKLDDPSKLKQIKDHKAFHQKFGKSYPIEYQINSIKDGKNIPTQTTLTDALFLSEMKHLCIISGHDIATLKGDLTFDISKGGEKYTKINGKPQSLKPEDIILNDNGKLITSLLYGPDNSTKITSKTKDCVYLFWFSSHITQKELITILNDFKAHLKIIANKESKIENIPIEITSKIKTIVTPWEVKGDINYDNLIREFGTQKITDDLLKTFEKHAGSLHYMLKRNIFFSHRELDVLFQEYEQGKEFALYTGRGPSGNTHVGHLIPWIFTKYMQDTFKADLYFQITDDEKFLCKPGLTLAETNTMGYENALDLIALGFDPKKTFIFVDTDYAKTLYKIAIQVAKKVTASTARAVFGFTNETNIGMYLWPALQAAPCFLPSILKGKKIRTLIPAAIDQDPYWRIVRDVAPKLGYPKTAAIHNVFLPALVGPQGKMSTSEGTQATIFTTDDEDTVKRKVMKYAFSGGKDTTEEHRKHGGNPDIDISYQWIRFFEEDDKKLQKIHDEYKSGKLLTGELKQILIDKLNSFLKQHQKKREQARKVLDKFVLKD